LAFSTTAVLLLVAVTVREPASVSASLTLNSMPMVLAGSVRSLITPLTKAAGVAVGLLLGRLRKGVILSASMTVSLSARIVGAVLLGVIGFTVVLIAAAVLLLSLL
jgi:hypothetical protein